MYTKTYQLDESPLAILPTALELDKHQELTLVAGVQGEVTLVVLLESVEVVGHESLPPHVRRQHLHLQIRLS
jgi:hypothetical protein